MYKYPVDHLRLPLKVSEVNLFGLLAAQTEDFDATDSIESVKAVRVTTVDGVDIACNINSPIVNEAARGVNMQGVLGSFANAPFAVFVNPETANARVSVELPSQYPMELYVELEIQRVNYNRRSA
jgi:hypothetical protein